MNPIPFFKMSGNGNDFIIVDNRNNVLKEKFLQDFVIGSCRRKMSAGANGVILIENDPEADFRWRFFNSDGSMGEMCGNGARCAARFACLNGIVGTEMSFRTDAGLVFAEVTGDQVKIGIPDPGSIREDIRIEIENTALQIATVTVGVPHAVLWVEDIEKTPVKNLGRKIRNHNIFSPAGTNVNFVRTGEEGGIYIRTYERGVEDETLACGTGAIAGSMVFARRYEKKSPIRVMTRSGTFLTVHFTEKQGRFYDVFLEGDARVIYRGQMGEEAWR